MQKGLGSALPMFAIAMFLCGIATAVVYSVDELAMRTLLHRLFDFHVLQRSFYDMMTKRSTATNAVTDVVLASDVFFPLFHIKTPNHRANTRKSRFLMPLTPAVNQATLPVLARRIAGWLHEPAATTTPIFYRVASALVSFMGPRLDQKSLFHCRGPARADCALVLHFRPSHRQSEVYSVSCSLMTGASVILHSGPASATAATWFNCLTLSITNKHASTVFSNEALSSPRVTSNAMLGQKHLTARSNIFHEIFSYSSLASLLELHVGSLAADIGFDFCPVLSASAFISRQSLMQLHFWHFAVVHVLQRWSINAIMCPLKSSQFFALPSHETGAAGSWNNQVAQRFFQIPLPFLVQSSVIGSCYAACFFCRHAFSESEHRVQNFASVGFFIFARCLAITALLGFCVAFCRHRRRIFTTCKQLVVSHDTHDLRFCRDLTESPNKAARQNLTQAFCCEHHIRNANCATHCPAGYSLFTLSGHEFFGAREMAYLIERVAAHLRIKYCALFSFSSSFNATFMILALHSLLCPITNAQPCDQMTLGMARSNLSSATLPTGLMFFAGGFTGASS
jgi:hypothetical protein